MVVEQVFAVQEVIVGAKMELRVQWMRAVRPLAEVEQWYGCHPAKGDAGTSCYQSLAPVEREPGPRCVAGRRLPLQLVVVCCCLRQVSMAPLGCLVRVHSLTHDSRGAVERMKWVTSDSPFADGCG